MPSSFNLKKYLPFILVAVGILLLGSFYFLFLRKGGDEDSGEDTSALIEVALPDRPYTSLTPKDDGHWLHLKIEKLKVPATSLDYELLYLLPSGEPQGVPGTIVLSGQTMIERDLLLGSESSGKFRYDEGVTNGTLTLRFRNDKGKLIAKFASDFHLQNSEKTLTSKDGKFKYTLDKNPTKTFFVTMPTIGVPGDLPSGTVSEGPHGVYSSSKAALPGVVNLSGNVQRWSGSAWQALSSGKSTDLGLFISTSE